MMKAKIGRDAKNSEKRALRAKTRAKVKEAKAKVASSCGLKKAAEGKKESSESSESSESDEAAATCPLSPASPCSINKLAKEKAAAKVNE